MIQFRQWGVFLFTVAVVVGLWWRYAELLSTEIRPRAPVENPPKEIIKHRIEGFHLVEGGLAGDRDWELKADVAVGSEEAGGWDFEKVTVTFYQGKVRKFWVVSSRGFIDLATKDMRMQGAVKTESANGYVMKSEDLHYLAKGRVLSVATGLSVVGPRDSDGVRTQMSAGKMRSEIEQAVIHLSGRVKIEKALPSGRPIQAVAEEAVLSQRDSSFELKHQVQLQYQSVAMQSEWAQFKYRHQSPAIFESIELQSQVKMSDANRFATAEAIFIEPDKNRFVLKGKPRLVQDGDEVTGDVMTFVDGGRRLLIDNVKARVEGGTPP